MKLTFVSNSSRTLLFNFSRTFTYIISFDWLFDSSGGKITSGQFNTEIN